MKTFKRCFFVTIILFAIVNLSNFTLAQNKTEISKPAPPKLEPIKPAPQKSAPIKPAPPKLEPQAQRIAGRNARFSVAQNNFPPLPSKIKPPALDELKLMQTKLERLKTPLPKIYAASYGEDWKTQGDWVGHYGRDYAVMCGASSPFDQMFFVDETEIKVRPFIGPNKRKGDSLRRWVHWIKSDDRRVMYSPLNGYRRQAEWDDHAETYPISHNGPDLWYLIEIKNAGVYKLSMYFFNKDGHHGNNRFRDFVVEIYPANVSWTKYSDAERFDKIAEAQTKRPPLARTRVNNFWGGVHKSFEVAGEGKYFVRVANNFCFCTILSSVCIDKLQGDSTINDKFELSLQLNVPYQPPQFPESISHPAAYQAKKLWDMFDNRYDRLGVVVIERDYRLRSIQTAANLPDNISKQLAQAMCWRLNLLDDQQRQTWNNALQEIQTRLIKQNPNHTSQQNELLNNTRNRTIWKYWKK